LLADNVHLRSLKELYIEVKVPAAENLRNQDSLFTASDLKFTHLDTLWINCKDHAQLFTCRNVPQDITIRKLFLGKFVFEGEFVKFFFKALKHVEEFTLNGCEFDHQFNPELAW
jgi:hypothetical protein